MFQRSATEEKLIQQKLKNTFSNFGNVRKIIITKPNLNLPEYIQAYLTFEDSDSALKAISDKNGSPWEGRLLKCSLGTTKYSKEKGSFKSKIFHLFWNFLKLILLR